MHDIAPYILTGLGVTALGTLGRIPQKLFGWVRGRALHTVEITNTDPCFKWVKQWLSVHAKCRHQSAMSVYPDESPSGERRKPTFCMSPLGVSWFNFRGRKVLSIVTKEAAEGTSEYREKISLQCWKSGEEIAHAILNEAYDLAHGLDGNTVEFWIPGTYGDSWRLASRKPSRQLDTISLPGLVGHNIIEDAKRFLESRDRYQRLGIPWHRGYLFHGPPGNGKTSMIHVLASALRMNTNALSLSNYDDDAKLFSAIMGVPSCHVLSIEDVDAAMHKGRESKGGITMSGLLNAIDGAAAQEGRILVMTTNHLDKLDPALIRPGRADVKVEFPNATHQTAVEMFQRFNPDASLSEAHAFGSAFTGKSMAAIQEELLGTSCGMVDGIEAAA